MSDFKTRHIFTLDILLTVKNIFGLIFKTFLTQIKKSYRLESPTHRFQIARSRIRCSGHGILML
jgi:hypothetical protein